MTCFEPLTEFSTSCLEHINFVLLLDNSVSRNIYYIKQLVHVSFKFYVTNMLKKKVDIMNGPVGVFSRAVDFHIKL